MKRIVAVLAIAALTSPVLAQTTKPQVPSKAELIVAEAVTALIFGPIAIAYGTSTGPWSSNPILGIEDRYKQVCEEILGGKWISGAPDSCPEGNWLRIWGYAKAK